MSQYHLPLRLPPHFSEDNFFASGCNREAFDWIDRWPRWPSHTLLLYGPRGSGKSHLGHIWAARARARTLPAFSLEALLLPENMSGSWLIEDIERLRHDQPLLHLFNFTRESGNYLLLTSAVAPSRLPLALPDLASRIMAAPCVAIEQPDDAVLAGAMRKQFSDRQLKIDEDVIAWLLPRIERSLAGVQDLVERIDAAALAGHKSITIPFVRKLLEASEKKEQST